MKDAQKLIKNLSHDAIDRAFLISAIEYYAHQILKDDSDWGQSFVNKDLWEVQAKHALATIAEHIGEH